MRAGIPFELDLRVRDGCVQLPGLGSLRICDQSPWVQLRCNGECVTAEGGFEAPWRQLLFIMVLVVVAAVALLVHP